MGDDKSRSKSYKDKSRSRSFVTISIRYLKLAHVISNSCKSMNF